MGEEAVTEAHPPGVDVSMRLTHGHVTCGCVRWHRPVPVEEEGHHPVPTGAPFHGDPKQALIWLCPTCHVNVHSAIRVHLKALRANRVPTVAELRPYSKFVRRLAEQAMAALGPQAEIDL